MDPAVTYLIGKVKKELKERGASGFHGLQRKFKIMDDDGSGSLNQAEFKKAMKEMNFYDITDRELATMYSHFGKCGTSLPYFV